MLRFRCVTVAVMKPHTCIPHTDKYRWVCHSSLGFIVAIFITSLRSERNVKAAVWIPTVQHRGAEMSWSKGRFPQLRHRSFLHSAALVFGFSFTQHDENQLCSSALIGLIIFHVPLTLLALVSAVPGLDVWLLWGSFPAAQRPIYNVVSPFDHHSPFSLFTSDNEMTDRSGPMLVSPSSVNELAHPAAPLLAFP